jgi:hypothetical protein
MFGQRLNLTYYVPVLFHEVNSEALLGLLARTRAKMNFKYAILARLNEGH